MMNICMIFLYCLESLDAFADKLRTNSSFFVRLASKPILKRNAALLFWGYNGSLEISEIFYLFDIGKLNSFIFKNFFNPQELTIDDITYEVKKITYNKSKIYALDNGSPYMFFTFYKGLLITAKNYNHIKKLIDFLHLRCRRNQ